MNSVESSTVSLEPTKPSHWFEIYGLSKHADARDADGIITKPDAAHVAYLSMYGAIQRSYPNNPARWLQVAGKLDTLLAELHGELEMRMAHSWLPDSRFDRIARANNHPEFTREQARSLFAAIGE
jgi:hypothetical protein